MISKTKENNSHLTTSFMRNLILSTILLLSILTSCGSGSKSEIEKLKAENDSLQTYKLKLEDEVNDYFSTLNDVQEGIAKIKAAQNIIPIRPLSENTPQDVRNRVNDDVAFINDLIKANQEELDKMRAKMKNSSFKLDNLEKSLEMLTKQLNEESDKVVRLQKQLLQKDSVINQLGNKVDDMGKSIDDLSQKNEEKANVIQQQDEAINSGWYAIGSTKELKDNKILSSEGLFVAKKILQSDFNKNYFVKVDTRETRSIPLYSEGKVKILTTHNRASYKVERENGSLVLTILNPTEFWSVSKYLVIEIN